MSRPSSRRRFIASTLALTAAPAVIAQERWPNRPIRMIVPYPAGGNSDMVARWAADRLAAESFGGGESSSSLSKNAYASLRGIGAALGESLGGG